MLRFSQLLKNQCTRLSFKFLKIIYKTFIILKSNKLLQASHLHLF